MLKTGYPWHADLYDAMKLNEVKLKSLGLPTFHGTIPKSVTTEETALSTQAGGSHYKDKKIQPVEYAHANNLGFMEANVVKYITRHKDKNKAEDIRKAIHYCQLILELEYGDKVDTFTCV